MPVYLGIDYGRAHVGLAYAERNLATPLPSLPNTSRSDLLARLARYLAKYRVTAIICGLPEGPLQAEVQSFAAELEAASGLGVILHPETLSSKEAITKLRAAGASRQKLQNDHAYAAVLILEDYLESVTLDPV